MEVLHDRVAGLDIHKETVVACVRSPGSGRSRRAETREFETFIDGLERLRDWLIAEGVTHVAMEATGIYWKPVWFVLEDGGFELLLVNARNMRMVPGRKTDVADDGWIAQLLECGLLRASLVPPLVIRELRDLTRYRKRLVQDRTREGQRVEKVLEDAGIKLASVASQTMSKSGRAMIDALIAGERDPVVLADLAKRRMRSKIPQLQRALVGRFGEHHATMLRLHLDHIDHLEALIDQLDEQIDAKLVPFADDLRRVQTITGIGETTAQVIIAEIGVDMTAFPTAGHLASWCGVCPGNNQSGQTTLRAHQPGQPMAHRRTHPSGMGSIPIAEHVARRALLASRPTHRQKEGDHRYRPRDRHRALAHAHQPVRLHRLGRRLVGQPLQHSHRDRPPETAPRSPRPSRHHRTRRLNIAAKRLGATAPILTRPTTRTTQLFTSD
jgi:transposase